MVAVVVFGAMLFGLAPRAEAFELLSWWRRDLIEVRWEPGDWATYAQTEFTEDGVFTDTLTVRVLAADDPDARWIELTTRGRDGADRVLLRPDALGRTDDPLAAVDSLVRREGDGPWIAEDLDEYRDQRLVQRHLSDPFVDPEITRTALADTTVGGAAFPRERIVMVESSREERKVGTSTLVIAAHLRATAELSPSVPLAGILRARSVSSVTTTTEGSGTRRRAAPPLVTERRIECIAFGRDAASSAAPDRP